jgi:hypothetical protein
MVLPRACRPVEWRASLKILQIDTNIEEGRAASRSPHSKFGYFLSMSQQAVSADIIPNSVVGIFSPKQKEKKLGYTDKLVTTQI